MKVTIRALRMICNMEPKDLAEKIGRPTSYVRKVENEYNSLSLTTFEEFARAFSLKPSELMFFVELEEKGATYENIVKSYLELKALKSVMAEYKTMAKTLKAMRLAEDKTQKELSNAFGLPTLYIELYENGKEKPTAEIISKYAEYFKVNERAIYKMFKLEETGVPFKQILIAYLELTKRE